MTLSRQLILTLLSLILVLVVSLFFLNLNQVQNLLSKQTSEQTQTAVDSLAISLKGYLTQQNIPIVEAAINGFFSSGHYQHLLISDARKKHTIIERKALTSQYDTPQWFIDFLPLQVHIKSAEILSYQSGHSQKSLITLEASNAYAYQQLWLALKDWVMVSALVFSVGMLALIFLLRFQLSPLKAIEKQALAISQRDFSINPQVPRSREMKAVVVAMNSMSSKLEHVVDELTEKAETLLGQVRIDDLTGLMNRQSFLENLYTVLNEPGVLVIFRVKNINAINSAYGYESGNQVLRTVAEVLQKEQEYYTEAFSGRISGTDFSIALPNLSLSEFHHVYEHLDTILQSLYAPQEHNSGVELVVGVAAYNAQHSVNEILAKTDHALAMAIHQEKPIVCIGDHDGYIAWSATDWGSFIDDCIQHDKISIAKQSLLDTQGNIVFNGILARPLLEPDKTLQTASFIAMTDLLGRGEQFDRFMVQKILGYASTQTDSGPWGIKLLSSSWYNDSFQEWFLDLLEDQPNFAKQLFVICSEASLMRDVAVSKRNIDQINALGGRIVMDHFGGSVSSFSNLRQLKPEYIRLDGNYIRDITYNEDHQLFLKVACDIAHTLDIGVIAEHVESHEIKTALEATDIDAIQGYAVSPVERLEST